MVYAYVICIYTVLFLQVRLATKRLQHMNAKVELSRRTNK